MQRHRTQASAVISGQTLLLSPLLCVQWRGHITALGRMNYNHIAHSMSGDTVAQITMALLTGYHRGKEEYEMCLESVSVFEYCLKNLKQREREFRCNIFLKFISVYRGSPV